MEKTRIKQFFGMQIGYALNANTYFLDTGLLHAECTVKWKP